MVAGYLTIDQLKPLFIQLSGEGDKTRLGCIVHPAEQGFAKKYLTQGYAGESAYQLLLLPYLNRMGKPEPVQVIVGRAHRLGNPGAASTRARCGAGAHNL